MEIVQCTSKYSCESRCLLLFYRQRNQLVLPPEVKTKTVIVLVSSLGRCPEFAHSQGRPRIQVNIIDKPDINDEVYFK